MAEYALTMDGTTVARTQDFKSAPADLSGHATKANWKWLVVTRLSALDGEAEGWTLDLQGGTASYRPAYVAPTPRRTGTAREFMALLTAQEKSALLTKARTNVQTQIWITEAMAGDVSLDHPTMLPALQAQEADGTIDKGRALEIQGGDFDA